MSEERNLDAAPWEDPAAFAKAQDYSEDLGETKVLQVVRVKKPNRQDYVRTHPEESFAADFPILLFEEDREHYVVKPDLVPALGVDVRQTKLVTYINTDGDIALWPIKQPDELGRWHSWPRSAWKAALEARERWVRVLPNLKTGAYEIRLPRGQIPDPQWPNYSFNEILQLAFQDSYVDSLQHFVAKRLIGEL
jgi:hypothetical protein